MKNYRYAIVASVGVAVGPVIIPILQKIESAISLNFNINPLASYGIPTEWMVLGLVGTGIASVMGGKKKC